MPRARFQKVDGQKREALLDAAAKELATHGYENASINRILEAAGFSKGSFYYYFEDKADLAATVIEGSVAASVALMSSLERPTERDAWWAELERMNVERLKLIRADPIRGEAMLRVGSVMLNVPALMQRLAPTLTHSRAEIMRFFQHAVEIGAVRSDIPLPVLMETMEAAKIALARVRLTPDVRHTDEELIAFGTEAIGLFRRIAEPAPLSKEAVR